MNIAHCAFLPPNGAIRWDNLKYLCISYGKLVDDSIEKILSGSPCLETLELRACYGVKRIDATSKRFKNLVYWRFANKLGRTLDDIEEELLSGLLRSLGHVNEIILGSTCLEVLSCLKAKGFQFSRDVTSRGDY
ncbi:putative F-box/LRR-repeat protein isoform X1 [Tanacetum coccineum]